MRDKRFVAEHRGGPLKKEQHKQLMEWAIACSEHVLPLLGEKPGEQLINALFIAKEWAKGNARTGEAMKASVAVHAAAREATNPITIAVSRSVGHAVATAHMADHSLGAALYALKAVNNAGKSVETERIWQNGQLQQEIKELVHSAMAENEKHFKILKTMKTPTSKPNNIDEYIAGFPDEIQKILEEIRTIIKKVAPEAKEKISYGMPAFTLNGILVYFAAFQNHIGFYALPSGNEEFKKEIARYKTGKGSIQFPLDKPMPLDLITKIVEYRVKENSEKAAKGKETKKAKLTSKTKMKETK